MLVLPNNYTGDVGVFRATVGDARLWRNVLAAVSTLIEEADLNATPEGFKVRSMDPSHIAMVDFEWGKEAFDEYSCLEPKKIRVNLAGMMKLLKRVGADDRLEVVYDDNTRRLTLTLKGKMARKFVLPTMDPAGEEVPTPKLAFNAKVKMPAEVLKDVIEDAKAVSDNIRLEATPERFVATAVSEMTTASIELDKQSEGLLELEVKEPSKAMFNLNYLGEIAKAGASTSDVVTIEFSTNMPIRLEFEIPQQGKLVYYLAPRIEAEQE